MDGPSANAVIQWLKWTVRCRAVWPQPDRVQPHLSQQAAVQWVILSFALCYLDYLLIITLAVECCPCVHTANPASIRLPCVSLPRGGGSCSVSEGPGKGSSDPIADPKTAFPAWFPSFLPAVHLADARSVSPPRPPSPHHSSFFQGAFPLRAKFLVTTLLISPVVNVLPWESGQEVSQTRGWVFLGNYVAPSCTLLLHISTLPPKNSSSCSHSSRFFPPAFSPRCTGHCDHYGSACREL